MMKKPLSICIAAVGILVFTSIPAAFGQNLGFYVKGDVGGAVTPAVDMEEFLGLNVSGMKLQLDPGIRAGVAGGYQFTDWFAAEAELGFMINEISSIEGGGSVHDATLSNVPFLVNAKFQYPTKRCPFTPYAGIGVGFSESIFDGSLTIGNWSVSGTDVTTVFAWQAFAGLRYAMTERMGLSVEYRYFEADSPGWDIELPSGSGTTSDTFGLGRIHTHAVSLAFDYRF